MADVVDAHGQTMTEHSSTALAHGFKFTTNSALTLKKVTKVSSCTATTCILTDSSHTTIDTQTFTGDDATFSQSLANATTYYIHTDKPGDSYERYYDSSVTYPINGTNINFTAGWQEGTGDVAVAMYDCVSITTDSSISVTFNAAALTLSTTSGEPVYTIQVNSLALDSNLTVSSPTVTFEYDVGGLRTKVVRTSYPSTDGITARTTSQQGHKMQLIPTEGSFVPQRFKKGM